MIDLSDGHIVDIMKLADF
ncbi:DUF1456 domain-containing protein, partial [Klebsiella aerogenes]|nr:DUF1456 domain-containing protein [Klebsiella aerogenes]